MNLFNLSAHFSGGFEASCSISLAERARLCICTSASRAAQILPDGSVAQKTSPACSAMRSPAVLSLAASCGLTCGSHLFSSGRESPVQILEPPR